MKVKVTKQAIEGAYWWLTYTGEQCPDIEDLYQAVQIMVTEMKSHTTSHGGYSGSSSSRFSESSHSGSTWNKSDTVADCSYVEVDFKLAAKIARLSGMRNSTYKARWNASVVGRLRGQGYPMGFKDFVSASSYTSFSSLQLGLRDIVVEIKQNSFQPTDSYSNLLWYKKLMEDFCTFDYTGAIEPHSDEQYRWEIPHKYHGFRVVITYQHGVYSTHINMCTMSDVGKKRVFECSSLDECKKVIKEAAFKLMPLLLSEGWGSGQILIENEIEGLYV